MIKLKTIIFILSLFVFVSITYAEDIFNTYETDIIETDLTDKRIISSNTIIQDKNEDAHIEQLIKEKVIPTKNDVFQGGCVELNKTTKDTMIPSSNRSITPSNPRTVRSVR